MGVSLESARATTMAREVSPREAPDACVESSKTYPEPLREGRGCRHGIHD